MNIVLSNDGSILTPNLLTNASRYSTLLPRRVIVPVTSVTITQPGQPTIIQTSPSSHRTPLPQAGPSYDLPNLSRFPSSDGEGKQPQELVDLMVSPHVVRNSNSPSPFHHIPVVGLSLLTVPIEVLKEIIEGEGNVLEEIFMFIVEIMA
ncbi:20629_t:CDS:2 [Dentiscutata erythropus]|uniref:20629_t:CDS:1 n=1 Tax=Dentiscutata erythropus TaxID=1348616 RepID=A0A9N8VU58_9GLOM|nr:20629_t:CDS:2 [Dentiscutata erythropus]